VPDGSRNLQGYRIPRRAHGIPCELLRVLRCKTAGAIGPPSSGSNKRARAQATPTIYDSAQSMPDATTLESEAWVLSEVHQSRFLLARVCTRRNVCSPECVISATPRLSAATWDACRRAGAHADSLRRLSLSSDAIAYCELAGFFWMPRGEHPFSPHDCHVRRLQASLAIATYGSRRMSLPSHSFLWSGLAVTHYGTFPIIFFASSTEKPRRVSVRTLPSDPAFRSAVVTASSVPSRISTPS
jgi:hypothetical protein